ncbi:MAG: MarR family transcriptional regulator [Syntrophomonadaceae bacterium]
MSSKSSSGSDQNKLPSARAGGFLIARVHYLADRLFARKLKEYNIKDLNPAQGRIMFVLWRRNDIPIQDLARQTSLGKSTLTSMLDRLEAAGHLERRADPHDRRSLLVSAREITTEEERLYEAVSREMAGEFYDGLSEAEIDQFERILAHILNNLDPDSESV